MRRKSSAKNNTKLFNQYGSTAELAAVLAIKERANNEWQCYSPFGTSSEKDFAGCTQDEAHELLSKGDATLAAKIRAEGEILCDANEAGRTRIETSIVGCVPCVPNYLRGVPNNMLRLQRQYNQTPVIDMYVNTSIYDGIDVTKTAHQGNVIANVIAATEQAGVRVNLYAVCGADGGGQQYGFSVKLKDADAPLNLFNVAYCICNRAFCRSTFLEWIEKHLAKVVTNYGRPLNANEFKSTFLPESFVISVMDMVRNNTTITELTKQVNDYIKKVQEK